MDRCGRHPHDEGSDHPDLGGLGRVDAGRQRPSDGDADQLPAHPRRGRGPRPAARPGDRAPRRHPRRRGRRPDRHDRHPGPEPAARPEPAVAAPDDRCLPPRRRAPRRRQPARGPLRHLRGGRRARHQRQTGDRVRAPGRVGLALGRAAGAAPRRHPRPEGRLAAPPRRAPRSPGRGATPGERRTGHPRPVTGDPGVVGHARRARSRTPRWSGGAARAPARRPGTRRAVRADRHGFAARPQPRRRGRRRALARRRGAQGLLRNPGRHDHRARRARSGARPSPGCATATSRG